MINFCYFAHEFTDQAAHRLWSDWKNPVFDICRHNPLKYVIRTIFKLANYFKVATTARENGLFVPWVQPTYKYTLDKEQGATLLIICIGHQLDATTFVVGEFQSVTASATQQFPLAHVLESDEPFKAKPSPEVVQNTTFDHYTLFGQLQSGAHSTVIWRSGAKATPGPRCFNGKLMVKTA